MCSELIDRLNSTYLKNAGSVTPNRIQKYLTEAERLTNLSIETGFDISEKVLTKFINRKGEIIADRFNNFKESLTQLAEIYKPSDIARIKVRSIRPDGSINKKRFRRDLKKGVI
jgi:hypothetical protein